MRRRRFTLTQTDIWPGFTDVISSMILVLIFVLTVYAIMQAELTSIIGGKQEAIRRLETQIEQLRQLFGRSRDRSQELERRLAQLTAELSLSEQERQRILESGAAMGQDLEASKAEIEALTRRIEEYLAQVQELSSKLSFAEAESERKEVRVQDLMANISLLQQTIDQLKGELGDTEAELAEKSISLADLRLQAEKQRKEIERLREMERYRSEFLASLRDVFEGNPNIRVVGDRFIFQAEVLFASGSARINEAGKAELAKFVDAFKQIQQRLPRKLNLNIQVQGHTDTDQIIFTDRFASNWELSTARATEVVKFFIARGIPPTMLSAAGYGEYFPRARGESAAAKRLNRRIEIKFTTP